MYSFHSENVLVFNGFSVMIFVVKTTATLQFFTEFWGLLVEHPINNIALLSIMVNQF